MSEALKIFDELVLTVERDNSSYPERFSLAPDQEGTLEDAVLQLVRKQFGATNAEPIPAKAPGPAHEPTEIECRSVLRVTNGYEAAFREVLSHLAKDVGSKLSGTNVRFWLQIGYSEMLDNAENMFGDYLYLRARLFAVRSCK